MNSTTGPIAIVVAMDAELVHFYQLAPVEREEQDGVWRDRFATVAGLPVVITKCGIGMIAAAAATEHLIDRHRPRAVLNFGCAGAHRRDIMPGDLIIGDRVVHHSKVHILATGEEHYTGQGYYVGEEKVEEAEITSDPEWLAAAARATESFTADDWPVEAGWPGGVPHRSPQVHTGAVASADIWTQAHERLDLLHSRHQTLCEDMEAAAIAQIATLHGIPFFTVKDISNNEYYRATDIASDMTDFPFAHAGNRAAGLLHATIVCIANQA
ncbi:MAG: 5'-methylthioadenosine/S-adenosylhomocysteine nucleosidase [Thermomicrobiales bacterium]